MKSYEKFEIIDWAEKEGVVFDVRAGRYGEPWEAPKLGKFLEDSSECTVFEKGDSVYKVLRTWDDIEKQSTLFNKVFPETAMKLYGVANVKSKYSDKPRQLPILQQYKVEGENSTKKDIDDLMEDKGFDKTVNYGLLDGYLNDRGWVVSDIAPGHNNVKDSDGEVKVFDADVFTSVGEFRGGR